MPSFASLLCGWLQFAAASAYVAAPHDHDARGHPSMPEGHPYIAPRADDSRGPCPMLNTLANHGYINRNGRNLTRQDIINAVDEAINFEESTIDTSLANALIVCDYVTGASCGTTLHNLTLLGEPHTFEHDHSFSREDYKMAYIENFQTDHTDNLSFNKTIFDGNLAPIGKNTHVNYADAELIRLQTESNALLEDFPGWFTENIPVQEFEFGLIFGVVGDFRLPGNANGDVQVRVDWWRYWFTNESFPYPLGWHKPPNRRSGAFIESVSSRILHASASSTPSPLPQSVFSSQPAPETLPPTPTHVFPLQTGAPYIGPIGLDEHSKRAGLQDRAVPASSPRTLNPAETAYPVPYYRKNPYVETLALSDIAIMQAMASSRASAVHKAMAVSTAKAQS